MDAATYAWVCADLARQWSAEEIFTSPLAFNIDASPVQRAILRVAEGRPLADLAADLAVQEALGRAIPSTRPKEIAIVSAVRAGKSLLSAALIVHAALTADLSRLGPGEIGRGAIVSTSLDVARNVYGHVVGRVLASPVLKHLVVGEPTRSRIVLRHPSGRHVEIVTSAGSRAGSSLVGRWMFAVVFSEFARMCQAGDGIINYEDSKTAVQERLLPGAYLISESAPWAPFGPCHKLVTEHHGKPTEQLAVFRAAGWIMLPSYWTAERVADAKTRDAYETDVACNFAEVAESLIPVAVVDRAMRDTGAPEAPVDGASYIAAIDPAARGNSFTLTVTTRAGEHRSVVLAHEWTGTARAPLVMGTVFRELAGLVAPYGVTFLYSDHWSVDALNELAQQNGLWIKAVQWTPTEKVDAYQRVRQLLDAGRLSLPDVEHLREDLIRVKRAVTRSGVRIDLPLTSDGRHCDYAPAIALTCNHWIDDVRDVTPDPRALDRERRERMLRRTAPKERWQE